MTFKTHIQTVKQKFFAARNTLLPLINRNSTMDLANKLLVFKLYLRPILTYAALSWCTAARSNINILEVIQNRYLRMITNSPWFIRNTQLRQDLNIHSIHDYLIILANKTWTRAENFENPLIIELVEPQDRPPPQRVIKTPLIVLEEAGFR